MLRALLTFALTCVLVEGTASAQTPETQPSPQTYRLTGTRIALGQDVRIERDEEVSDAVVVVGGNLVVEGRVRDGIVVAGGDLRLTSTSDVRGDIVIVGGTVTRDAGARQFGSVSNVSFGDWWSRQGWGWIPSIRFGEFGRWLSLAGTIARISLLALLMAVLLTIGRAAVARAGRAASAEPLRALLIGLAAEILFVPALVAASIGLAITIIGIPFVAVLVPIAIILLVFAFLLGFTAVACRLGEWIEDRMGWQPGNAFIATAMGFFVLLSPTILARLLDVTSTSAAPLTFALVMLGLTIEAIVWTIGLGAALITGLGRWYTVPPPIATAPPVVTDPARGQA
jgi:hypothetical protein